MIRGSRSKPNLCLGNVKVPSEFQIAEVSTLMLRYGLPVLEELKMAIKVRARLRRLPNRAQYDENSIHRILDAGFLAHVGFLVDSQPFVIPTLYGRHENTIFLHGSAASRMLKSLAAGVACCATVTLIDGLVLARSAFNHSMNYRSVVMFGTARLVEGGEKLFGLETISEHLLAGRWSDVRPPSTK